MTVENCEAFRNATRASTANGTNASEGAGPESQWSLAPLPKLIPGLVVFLVVLPFVLFQVRRFPLSTTAAALTGACLMVMTGVISQREVYEILGEPENLRTIYLLLGMMLLAQYFERERLVEAILNKLLSGSLSFECYLFRISILTAAISAIFTNDAACVVLTPLLMMVWRRQRRPAAELPTLLLAVATSSNIGSVITIFGNPQMALIAAKTEGPLYSDSALDLRTTLVFLGLPAVLGLALNLGILLLWHRLRQGTLLKKRGRTGKKGISTEVELGPEEVEQMVANALQCSDNPDSDLTLVDVRVIKGQHSTTTDNGAIATASNDLADPEVPALAAPLQEETCSGLSAIPEDSVLEMEEEEDGDGLRALRHRSWEEQGSDGQQADSGHVVAVEEFPSREDPALLVSERLGLYRSLTAITPVSPGMLADKPCEDDPTATLDPEFTPTNSRVFKAILIVVMVTVVALLFVRTSTIAFDMGLVPIAGSTVLMITDAIISRRGSGAVLKRVDWGVLLMFFAIFVWLRGVNVTQVPRWVWHHLGLAGSDVTSPLEILILVVFIVVGSNLFSNVPLTLLVLEQLEPCRGQLGLVLALAWVSTVAGNLTLFGSVANLIVAERSSQAGGSRPLTFYIHLQVGVPSTLLVLAVGLPVVYGLLACIPWA